MVRKYYSVVLFALALLFAGCSSHPPSAAQFMNVHEKRNKIGTSFIVGGSVRAGDIYKEHVNGESIQWDDYGGAEFYGNLDLSFLFRYNHLIVGSSLENLSHRGVVGFVSRYIGLQGWGGLALDSFFPNKSTSYGGVMLIEEYPINDNLKVGLSEHISHNAYQVDQINEGIDCSSSDYYNEFGFGTYLTYKNFSVEFRYGREMDEPRNRFYFMLNYAFRAKDKSTPEFELYYDY